MSIKVMTAVWEHSRARGNALLVLLAIADWSDDFGESYPSITQLAKKTRSTRQTVFNAIEELKGYGELKAAPRTHVEHRPNRAALIGFQATTAYFITAKILDRTGGQKIRPPDAVQSEKQAKLPVKPLDHLAGQKIRPPSRDQVVKNTRDQVVKNFNVSFPSDRTNTSGVRTQDRSDQLVSTDSDHAITAGARDHRSAAAFFDHEFWPAYPKQKAKARARAAMLNLKPDADTQQAMMAGLAVQREQPAWNRRDSDEPDRFIPLASTWINEQRWLDTVARPSRVRNVGLSRPCDHTPRCRGTHWCYELRQAEATGDQEQIDMARRLARSAG